MATPSETSIMNPFEGDPAAAPVFPTEIFSKIVYQVAVSKRPRPRYPISHAASDSQRRERDPFFRLQNLRLVSREFAKLAADHLFHRLSVSEYSHCDDLWRALADGSTCLGSSVRTISVALSSFSSAGSQRMHRELILQEMELLELVARAIPKLPLLLEASIHWPDSVFNPPDRSSSRKPLVTARALACVNRILAGLATQPRVPLRALSVNGSVECAGFPSVGGFTELRSLTIRHPLDADMVSALIADNPHLHTLTISGHFIFSIRDLLPSLMPDADRQLKALSVERLTFSRGDVPFLVPFFKEVEILTFWNMLDIPDTLWMELNGLCTTPSQFLRRLSMNDCQMYLTESFVDFVSSCSVLESLCFSSTLLDFEEYKVGVVNTSSRTIRRFWLDALPRLAGSLRRLELSGPEISGLCIQDVRYIDALSNCHLLEVLKVAVNADLANAAQTRSIMHCILTNLCQNSWPAMASLCMNKCPAFRAESPPTFGNYHYNANPDRGTSNLLLHNTVFESVTEQIFKTRIHIFFACHVFKRVDGVVRFLERRLEEQGGQVAVNGGDHAESNEVGSLPWFS